MTAKICKGRKKMLWQKKIKNLLLSELILLYLPIVSLKQIVMVKEVKVKDIKKGDRVFPQENGGWKYMAHSDCYYDNNACVWRIDIGDGYTYGFTSNGDGKVTILQGN